MEPVTAGQQSHLLTSLKVHQTDRALIGLLVTDDALSLRPLGQLTTPDPGVPLLGVLVPPHCLLLAEGGEDSGDLCRGEPLGWGGGGVRGGGGGLEGIHRHVLVKATQHTA